MPIHWAKVLGTHYVTGITLSSSDTVMSKTVKCKLPDCAEHALWRKTGKELHYTVVIRHRSKITHNMCLLVCSTNRRLLPSSPFEVEETEAQKSWILFPAHLANKKQSCWPSCPAVWCQSLCSYLPFYPMHCHQLASGETSKTHPVAFSTGLTGRTDMYT